jgi:hypothetical protein
MIHELREIEWSRKAGDPVYLRFATTPVTRTEAHANGEVNVDLDAQGGVVGIEMLSTDPGEWAAVGRIAERYHLRFDLFFHGATTGAA